MKGLNLLLSSLIFAAMFVLICGIGPIFKETGYYKYPFLVEVHRYSIWPLFSSYVGQGVLVHPAFVLVTYDVLFRALEYDRKLVIKTYIRGGFQYYYMANKEFWPWGAKVHLTEPFDLEGFSIFNEIPKPIVQQVVYTVHYQPHYLWGFIKVWTLSTFESHYFTILNRTECKKQYNQESFDDIYREIYENSFCILLEDGKVFLEASRGLPFIVEDKVKGLLWRPLNMSNKCGVFVEAHSFATIDFFYNDENERV